ncbi:hypothetical protein GCM10009007_03250 [Formosimonas limnophila]|uniref:Uncharacterized protein n=1 Tax=Formosimonas limnophila TaxID=1384487 RepID=A0A8J3CFT0_9BURK|nr:hypothetical protein [Formosimonas limnophila]GHA66146.1 hypothetical protein GCM10009007_03250 [Formosimonas limnophila]
MKVIKGNADAITCAGTMFSIINGGSIVQTMKKSDAPYEAKTVVIDGVAAVTFNIDTNVGTLEVQASVDEWRDISDSRGLVQKTKTVLTKTVRAISSYIESGNKNDGPCCGGGM